MTFGYRLLFALASLMAVLSSASAAEFNLRAFEPKADGVTDDMPALQRCFDAVSKAGGGVVTIPSGNYYLSGAPSVPLVSRTTVFAYGARFHLPKTLGDQARIVVFKGENVQDFSWFGGHFAGHCFDHRRPAATKQPNTWEPNVNTRILVINTGLNGVTDQLTFRDITSERIAGAVINVEGHAKPGTESEVDTFATNITVENCTLLESGKFMWDYGMLWQIMIWPEDYSPHDVATAKRYFRNDLVREGLKINDGDNRIAFDNTQRPITVGTPPATPSTDPSEPSKRMACFYGDALPKNIVRGRGYHIVEAGNDFIRVSESPGGEPITFQGSAGPQVKMMHNLRAAFYELYAPTNSGPGKGAVDIVCAKNVRLSGCKLSALGDTMHVQRSHDIVFNDNHIIGSRMGAFFLAEYCKNATVTGNVIDGTNGSRVMSVEKSTSNVTIIGNTFRNGGRGSWINQPRNFILQGNVFINNTTKGERDRWRGRRNFWPDGWENYAELYFTLHEQDGKYGPVIVRDNIFVTGPEAKAAIQFAREGHDVLVQGNVFKGRTGKILLDDSSAEIKMENNLGATIEPARTDAEAKGK